MELNKMENGQRVVTLTVPELAYFITRHSPVANPGPLGLAGFALTTFVLSVFNTGNCTFSFFC
jgi:succinate-acetate transporter protein